MYCGQEENMVFSILENEYWYGGYVFGSYVQPYDASSEAEIDLRRNDSTNQAMPFFVSTKGRYLWCDEGFLLHFGGGNIAIDRDVELREGYVNLKGAYLAASREHFPFGKEGPSDEFFKNPVYNSWIELTFWQNEEAILKYADSILDNGMSAGVLMIDDGWSDYYGKWEFSKEKFPHAEEMLKTLHSKGFSVMLWICPYITPDTLQYRQAKEMDILIKNPDGKPLITEWWNGYSAALDLSNPAAVEWLDKQLKALREIGVDGFKFDGADVLYYPDDIMTAGSVTPNEMARLWCAYAEKYAFNELRMAFKAGGMALMQRLCDKPHNWGEEGIRALVPDTLMQGITGHPFGSPDMIGGGEYMNFRENSGNLDQELFNRHSEIACLLPVMQFSAAPWRVLGKESYDRILKSVRLRERYAPKILELAHHAARTGEPVARYMAYEFPEGGYERVNDQFMLGEDILVAPICEKGRTSRNVAVPKGRWRFQGTVIESEGGVMELTPEEGVPIVLEKCE